MNPPRSQHQDHDKSSTGFERVGSIVKRMMTNLIERGDMLAEKGGSENA